MHPTSTRVQPVAHGGIEANIGEKKIEIRKQTPVVTAVKPVLPPSEIPAPDSMKAVTGLVPSTAPTEMLSASVQYAIVERGNAPVSGSTTPENRAILYNVAVQSIISTYKNVNNARANCDGALNTDQSIAFLVCWIGWNVTTFLKNSNRSSPAASCGK